MCNDRQESMEGLLPSNPWGCGGGHGASGLAIVRPSSSGPLALFQICICIFLRCALLIRRRVAARRRPFPESPEVVPSPPQSPPAAGWTTMPSTSPRESESRHLQTPRFQCRAGMDVAVHFAIPRANPEVFEESSGQAREVREGRPLASPDRVQQLGFSCAQRCRWPGGSLPCLLVPHFSLCSAGRRLPPSTKIRAVLAVSTFASPVPTKHPID